MSTKRKTIEDAVVAYLLQDTTLTALATPRNYWDQSTARPVQACWVQVAEPENRNFGEQGGGAYWQADVRLYGQTLSNEDADGADLDAIMVRLHVFSTAIMSNPALVVVGGVTFYAWLPQPPDEQFMDGVQARGLVFTVHFEA
jgi:hypothetical protein